METKVKLADEICENEKMFEYNFIGEDGYKYAVKSSFIIGIPFLGCSARLRYIKSMDEYIAVINYK